MLPCHSSRGSLTTRGCMIAYEQICSNIYSFIRIENFQLLLWDERVRIEQYLDMPGCKNKGYLLKRIRDLADGNLSFYRWNAGGEYRGKPWTSDWPTDAQVLLKRHIAMEACTWLYTPENQHETCGSG